MSVFQVEAKLKILGGILLVISSVAFIFINAALIVAVSEIKIKGKINWKRVIKYEAILIASIAVGIFLLS